MLRILKYFIPISQSHHRYKIFLHLTSHNLIFISVWVFYDSLETHPITLARNISNLTCWSRSISFNNDLATFFYSYEKREKIILTQNDTQLFVSLLSFHSPLFFHLEPNVSLFHLMTLHLLLHRFPIISVKNYNTEDKEEKGEVSEKMARKSKRNLKGVLFWSFFLVFSVAFIARQAL